MEIGKAAIITPAYMYVAWALMISYQFFTETAVKTIMGEVTILWPQLGSWLSTKIDLVVFIYAFTWVYVLSSVIPPLILGKERSLLIQFLFVLALTVPVLISHDILLTYAGAEVEGILSLAVLLNNPLDATSFLFLPYILIILIDLLGRAKKNRSVTRNTI
jgi:hypothetical protein